MIKCPDVITWQAFLDGEDNGEGYLQHLNTCPPCRELYNDLYSTINVANMLDIPDVELSSGVTERILVSAENASSISHKDLQEMQDTQVFPLTLTSHSPFPAGLVAGFLFTLVLLAVTILGVITIDALYLVQVVQNLITYANQFFSILAFMGEVGPTPWLIGVLLVVVVEVIILNKIKSVEGVCVE